MTRSFEELTTAEFEAFAQTHADGSYLQTASQARLLARRGWQTSLVGLVEDHKVQAAAVLGWIPVKMGNLFQIDGGMLIDFSNQELVTEFVAGVMAFAKEHQGLFLRIMPNAIYRKFNDDGTQIGTDDNTVIDALMAIGFTHAPATQGWTTNSSPSRQYVKSLKPVLDVDGDSKALRASFAKDGKYYLKKTDQFGIKVHRLAKDELPAFKALTQDTANRLDYHDKDLDFYETVFEEYGDDAYFVFAEMDFPAYIKGQQQARDHLAEVVANLDARIAEKPNYKKLKRQRAEYADQHKQHEKRIAQAQTARQEAGKDVVVIAGALFLATANEMIYLYSGTYDEYKNFYGPYAVQEYAFKQAVARKIPNYNFYGISGVFDGSDGVLGFKQGFAGYAEEKVGSFIKPINSTKYAVYRFLKKILARG
ncbi:aminoacyltransferase [Weissella hellenica]|uniref:Aminoacyltransferase FemA n=1 Tax=Weissella hellenica TaxID=46256 RepID=A0A4Y4G2H8_WEIHE|nr:aminoacyltransferase [Weissella hellenica]NKY66731.1 aminoacyltransferase [Weissella hellenica]GED36007.1 methicillin resistance factor FemB [Weissella hellenica]SCB86825.1 alanine adding enzyme [Weissella hellenica]